MSNVTDIDNTLERLFALDHAGIASGEFLKLFMSCGFCKLVMTRRASRRHICTKLPRIIDLTLDDSDYSDSSVN